MKPYNPKPNTKIKMIEKKLEAKLYRRILMNRINFFISKYLNMELKIGTKILTVV
jgi:hypothetical protein